MQYLGTIHSANPDYAFSILLYYNKWGITVIYSLPEGYKRIVYLLARLIFWATGAVHSALQLLVEGGYPILLWLCITHVHLWYRGAHTHTHTHTQNCLQSPSFHRQIKSKFYWGHSSYCLHCHLSHPLPSLSLSLSLSLCLPSSRSVSIKFFGIIC